MFHTDTSYALLIKEEYLRDPQKKYEFLTLDIEIDARVTQLYKLTEDEYAIILEGAEDEFRIKALKFYSDLLKGT
jgi:hypothetical protein